MILTIDTCPKCGKPCHATEGNEDGVHPACMKAPKLTKAQREALHRLQYTTKAEGAK